jgi:uncharacterized protein YjiS (DUF1127 family)
MLIKTHYMSASSHQPENGFSVFGLIVNWMDRRNQRRALKDLDQRLLKDIGISNAARAEEINKPFWRR